MEGSIHWAVGYTTIIGYSLGFCDVLAGSMLRSSNTVWQKT